MLVEPGNRDGEQMAVRHANASGGDITENQHEENRMRDIHVGTRGSEAASEEQPDKLRKTAPSAPSSGHVDDDVQISALAAFYEMDRRKSRYIREVLDWYRREDAGSLKRSELNESVENMTCLNALAGEMWKINPKIVTDEKKFNPKIVTDEKSWKTWKRNQKIAKNEELVQNNVMNENFVKNFVMNVKIDPKVVMDLSIFTIDGWNSFQPSSQKLMEEFIDENEPWLLTGIPRKDPFLVTQHLERHSVS